MATPEPVERKAGEALIDAAHVCGQVTTLHTMEANAAEGMRLGAVTPADYAVTIDHVKNGFHHVLIDDSDVGKAVRTAAKYLETAEPPGDGSSYDPNADEWRDLVFAIAQACRAADSDLTALLDYGG